MTGIEERAQRVAQSKWPYLWDADRLEGQLAKLSIFTPEQAAESAERKRAEKVELVRQILDADAAVDVAMNARSADDLWTLVRADVMRRLEALGLVPNFEERVVIAEHAAREVIELVELERRRRA